uniref:Uncharacterized protein n=1 Tax=Globodera rostochiensis TaxID=31243 RepID=A0A914I298_GLORO
MVGKKRVFGWLPSSAEQFLRSRRPTIDWPRRRSFPLRGEEEAGERTLNGRTGGRIANAKEPVPPLPLLQFSSLSPQPIQLEQQQKEESCAGKERRIVSTASVAARAHAARAEGGADDDDGLKSSRPSPPRRRRRAAAAGS